MSPAPATAHAVSAAERAPLLDLYASVEEEGMGRPDAQEPGRTPSAFELVGRNSAAGGWAVLTQVGLVGSTAVLWRVLYKHPAGLFTYHPSFQSLAVLGFLEGILLLQPQPPNATYKRKGLQLHQVVQYTSCAVIVAGAVSIIYNKVAHGARHFTTWHAKAGLLEPFLPLPPSLFTLILISLQISFGALIVYTPLQRLLGGQERVKKLWKYHRMTGYLTLYFLILTPLLALASDWVRQNSSSVERWVIGSGLGVAGFGALARVQTSKLGSKTR
ncbi:hypothetical protein JCM10295v2_000851 [Rhodotorula toruloides]